MYPSGRSDFNIPYKRVPWLGKTFYCVHLLKKLKLLDASLLKHHQLDHDKQIVQICILQLYYIPILIRSDKKSSTRFKEYRTESICLLLHQQHHLSQIKRGGTASYRCIFVLVREKSNDLSLREKSLMVSIKRAK